MRRALVVAVAVNMLCGAGAAAAKRTDGSVPTSAQVVRLVTHVPQSTLDKIGAGTVLGPASFEVAKLHGAALRGQSLPELLTMNLAWCPHCAANSWALAVALSRFGSLSRLRSIDTGTLFGTKFHAHPSFPHTHGLSFLTARYKSRYLSFAAVVVQDLAGRDLENPTAAQLNAVTAFDPNLGFPAVDVGGSYGFVSSGFSPGVLAHLSWSEIARRLANPRNAVAQGVDGLANVFSAAICTATGDKPRGLCSSRGVRAAAAARLS